MTKTDEQPIVDLDLDHIHADKVRQLEAEDKTIEPETPEVKEPEVKEPEIKEEPKEEIKDEPVVITPEPKIEAKEIDTDITKQAEGKIAIKDSDGNTFYFNNLAEVPDDFEPATYKEWGRAVAELTEKGLADKELAKESKLREEQTRQQKEVDAVTAAWDKDIESLMKAGVLPKDEMERKKEINDVYAYISKGIGEGKLIDSWSEAYKSMKYEQTTAEKTKTIKDKGSKVMGSSSAASGKSSPAPLPSGISLDQVHARYSGLI